MLLPGEDVGDCLALPRVPLCTRDRIFPCGGILRVARKEWGDSGIVAGVIGREPFDPGKPSNVDGNAGDRLGETCLG